MMRRNVHAGDGAAGVARLARILAACWCAAMAPVMPALATPACSAVLWLDAPESVGDGKPFVVTVTADAPDDVVLEWRGKAVTVPVAAASAGRVWTGQAILAVPLDTRPGTERVRARTAGKSGTAPGAPGAPDRAEVTRGIVVVRAAYPEQRLTVAGRYVNPDEAALDRHEAERARVRAALALRTPERLWALPMARPVPGGVSSLFGLRRVFNGEPRAAHRGLDLRGRTGEPVAACAAGRVVLAEKQYFAGNSVYLDHGMGVVSMYCHLSAMEVVPGQVVGRGQVIGRVGSTGRVTGPHLHLGMAVLGDMVDPRVLLEDAPGDTGANTGE